MVPGNKVRNQSKHAQALWCMLNKKAAGQAIPAVSSNGEGIEHMKLNSLWYFGIHFYRMLMYKPQVKSREKKNQVQGRTALAESHGCKRNWTTSSVQAVSECNTRHHWLWSGSHNPATVQPAETWMVQNKAMRVTVILRTTKDSPNEAMHNLLDLPQDIRWTKSKHINAMHNPKNPLHNAVKEERGCRLARGRSWTGQAEVIPACVRPQRAKASKRLVKTPSWVQLQALLPDFTARESSHALPWIASWKSQCRSTIACQSQQQATWHPDSKGQFKS